MSWVQMDLCIWSFGNDDDNTQKQTVD